MKKINSLHFGTKFLKWILLFLIGIPLLCALLRRYIDTILLSCIQTIAFALGGILLLILFFLWWIEFKQDKFLNDYYAANMDTKNAMGSGRYECQHCGYLGLLESHKTCPICNTRFKAGGAPQARPSKWYLR